MREKLSQDRVVWGGGVRVQIGDFAWLFCLFTLHFACFLYFRPPKKATTTPCAASAPAVLPSTGKKRTGAVVVGPARRSMATCSWPGSRAWTARPRYGQRQGVRSRARRVEGRVVWKAPFRTLLFAGQVAVELMREDEGRRAGIVGLVGMTLPLLQAAKLSLGSEGLSTRLIECRILMNDTPPIQRGFTSQMGGFRFVFISPIESSGLSIALFGSKSIPSGDPQV